jgi:uncharacterized protein
VVDFRFDGPPGAAVQIVLAHGAGAPMDDPFLEAIAGGLAARGLRVARFEFPYMAARRAKGARNFPRSEPNASGAGGAEGAHNFPRSEPKASGEGGAEGALQMGPDRPPVLLATWRAVVEALGGGGALVIGGKSMGGRIASMVADEVGARGLVCLGYPFHPPRKPEQLRTAHLATLRTPTLIVQGTRDSFGTPGEVAGYTLSPAVRVAWIEDGDHSLVPRRASGRTRAQNVQAAIEAVATFTSAL